MKPFLVRAAARRRPSLQAPLLVLSAACLACGAESPVLAPRGHGERFELVSAGPPILIGAPGAASPESLSVIVQPLPRREDSASGVEVRFRVLRGGGRLLQDTAFTGADGLASVGYAPAASVDSTLVQASIAGDAGAALAIAVLTRTTVALEADSGGVLAIPGASRGVLLRIPAGTVYDLIPYVTSAERGGLEYAFRHDSVIRLSGGAPAAPAPPLGRARPSPLPVHGRGPSAPPLGLPATQDGLPPLYDIFNCRLALHRPAHLAHVGREIALYVDALEPPDPTRLEEIARGFDTQVAPRVRALFGDPLDLDGNGRVIAVLSRSMPGTSGVYCHSLHRLGREVVYAAWKPELGVAEHLGVLAHEYQHVINASQHYRWGHTAETSDVTWVNEGFSHVAEWKAGFPGGDLSRTLAFLTRVNGGLPLLGQHYQGDFFGGWFLFALYLGDRFGETVYQTLGESGLVGRDNVERVTGIPFRDLLRDWFVTLALSDAPAGPEPAWSYRSIHLAGEEERAAACGCLPADRLPGVAFEESTLDGTFTLLRTLGTQDADFFRFATGEAPGVLYFHAGEEPDVELFAVRRR